LQYWVSDGEDVADQDELDAAMAFLETTDRDPLAWQANPAVSALVRQGLLSGKLGVE
jgi:hypothetical protein